MGAAGPRQLGLRLVARVAAAASCDCPTTHLRVYLQFSDAHVIIFLIVSSSSVPAICCCRITPQCHIVHFNDIDSFYPTLSLSDRGLLGALYASIQTFNPELWKAFLFPPTLNPFSVPLALGVILSSVWAMLIVGLAAVDDVRHQLPFGDAVLYLADWPPCVPSITLSSASPPCMSLVICCSQSISILPSDSISGSQARFVCGKCGAKLRQ
jgi:hypothetical protein